MYRRFYSYNDMPVPIKPEQKPIQTNNSMVKKEQQKIKKNGFADNLKIDDIIILAVILILLIDDCDDILLLGALAFIFINRE